MKLEYLKKMDEKVRKAHSTKPEHILDYLGAKEMSPGYSADGFVARRKSLLYYGVNEGFKGNKRKFAIMHEGYHIVCGHIFLPGFLSGGDVPTHLDLPGSMGQYKMVVSTERDSDIGAADSVCDTDATLEMIGYDNADVIQFRRALETFEIHKKEYERHLDLVRSSSSPESRIRRMMAYQEDLEKMYKELQEQAQDLSNSGICLTKTAMAKELDVPEYIVDYKLEALSIRKYKVPTFELPSFNTVFKRWD